MILPHDHHRVHAELEERRATTEASLGQLRGEVAVFRSSLGLCFDMQEGV